MPVVNESSGILRRLVTLVCVAGLVVPLTGGAVAADPRGELDKVRRELQGARGGLEQIEGRRSVTVADLEESQARQAVLGKKLETLNGELHVSQASLGEATTALQQTAADLVAAEERLGDTRDDLTEARGVFADRARASYMYGGGGPSSATALFGLEDATEFNQAMAYVQRVMANDRQQVALIGNLERQVEATRVELAAVKDRRREERQLAQAERDRVAGLVSEQRSLHDAVAAEADRHAVILAELDADRSTHVALIDSLEQDSAQLEEELRRRAEEARRAEEIRLAEESRRVAAADAPRASRSAPVAGPAPAAGAPATADSSPGSWRRPSDGPATSGYGMRRHPISGTSRMHTGVDFGAPMGASIYAATDGTVVSAGWRGGYGLAVVVDHGGGVATLYAHASRLNVSPGQRVSRGQVIAATGSTGQSTGPHLHFEVRVNGQPRDPMPYL